MKSLTKPISEILDSYKRVLRDLHPYEATVADLTIATRVKAGHPHLDTVLADLKELRMQTSRLAKDHASRASKASSAEDAKEILESGMDALQELYGDPARSGALAELLGVQNDLRRIPVIELSTPTVVLIGSPNVGKSSIVNKVSTGRPEINDYPFTTRGVTIGHITDDARNVRFQVMDTPGLLDRPTEERNEMENLTFASLAHLPTAVIFVFDPSGLSGEKSSFDAQLNIRNRLRTQFPKRPWLDVVSKMDLDISPDILTTVPDGYLPISVQNEVNITELKEHIEEMMVVLKDMLQVKI
jgi:nucleolar GTP-binding protein